MKNMKQKIVTILMAISFAFSGLVVTAGMASAATPNSGPGYTQYWVYKDWCPKGTVWVHRDWFIRTDYNAWYETLYGLKDYNRYDHTDYRVAQYVWPC